MARGNGMPAGPRVIDCTHRVTHYRGKTKANGNGRAYQLRYCLGCQRTIKVDGLSRPVFGGEEARA